MSDDRPRHTYLFEVEIEVTDPCYQMFIGIGGSLVIIDDEHSDGEHLGMERVTPATVARDIQAGLRRDLDGMWRVSSIRPAKGAK